METALLVILLLMLGYQAWVALPESQQRIEQRLREVEQRLAALSVRQAESISDDDDNNDKSTRSA